MAISGHNQSEKIRRCEDYIRALEEERTKIQAFQRELPLCLELVTQAIESYKQLLSETNECNLQSEGSSKVHVLEELVCIPTVIKRASSNSDDFKKPKIDDASVSDKDRENVCSNNKKSSKSDWLISDLIHDSTKTVGVKKDWSGGAFHPFKKEKNADVVSENKKEDQDKTLRKSRRCWSAHLHKRFLQALDELGGSHVATPKQIRDLMKVEGLTNDEVKSHLQKYRLHERRPIPSSRNLAAVSTQTPQFVVWMPAATTTTSNGIYAPVASLPPPFPETSDSLT